MSGGQTRDYQLSSLEQIRNKFMEGYRSPLLWLATGAGKTWVFCLMIKEAVSRGKSAVVIVRGRKLVDQASQRLFREGVPHGVVMASHWNYRPSASVQVCSVDTCISRDHWPKADLVIIDEAHLFTFGSEAGKIREKYPDAFFVPVTATPWPEKGLSHIADCIVHPITMEGLIDEGYLCPFRYFAPSEPDLTDVKISATTKDYVSDQLEGAMVKGQLTGKVIETWKKIGNGLPTIGFAVNVNHSKFLTQKFIDAGIPAEHCDADVPDKERNEIIKRLESGETKVVFNVGIFCTGVDIPSLGCIILARPTKSLNLFIQQCGRGTRLFEGKEHCILLDHAGNLREHGFPTDEPEVDLVGAKREKAERKSKICKNCFAVYRGSQCPECGTVPPVAPEIEISETDEELKEITLLEKDPIRKLLKELLKEAKKTGKKTGWAYHRLVNRCGFEESKPHLPQWFIDNFERGRASLFSRSPFKGIGKPQDGQ